MHPCTAQETPERHVQRSPAKSWGLPAGLLQVQRNQHGVAELQQSYNNNAMTFIINPEFALKNMHNTMLLKDEASIKEYTEHLNRMLQMVGEDFIKGADQMVDTCLSALQRQNGTFRSRWIEKTRILHPRACSITVISYAYSWISNLLIYVLNYLRVKSFQ